MGGIPPTESFSTAWVVLLKAPLPGFAKTRLAADLGEAKALKAYQTLLECLLDQLACLDRVELRVTPPESVDWALGICRRPSWVVGSQGEGDLGDRLRRAVQSALRHHQAVVVIGADCPYINHKDITQALEGLITHDAVIGPAEDGGYWLIGLKRDHPDLFTGISWSESTVYHQTIERLSHAGLTVKRLRSLEDVDEQGAWCRFLQHQQKSLQDSE